MPIPRTASTAGMPIVDVHIVQDQAAAATAGLSQRIADALGLALGAPPGRLWVRLHWIEPTHYAENGLPVAAGERPVFVSLLHADPPEGAARADQAAAVAATLADCLERSVERVHVEFAPAAAGRIAFGGTLQARPQGGSR
jgi:phenylpyruvate tautomerase PptA (4-oxalocrotonate tautomerase family)